MLNAPPSDRIRAPSASTHTAQASPVSTPTGIISTPAGPPAAPNASSTR